MSDIVRAAIERDTAAIEYHRARVELAGKLCTVVAAVVGLATALVAATTMLVLYFLG